MGAVGGALCGQLAKGLRGPDQAPLPAATLQVPQTGQRGLRRPRHPRREELAEGPLHILQQRAGHLRTRRAGADDAPRFPRGQEPEGPHREGDVTAGGLAGAVAAGVADVSGDEEAHGAGEGVHVGHRAPAASKLQHLPGREVPASRGQRGAGDGPFQGGVGDGPGVPRPLGHLRGHLPGHLPWGPWSRGHRRVGGGPTGRRLGVLALVDQDGAQQVAAEGGGGTGAAPLGQTGPGREQAGHAVRPAHLQIPLGAFPQLAGEVAGFDLRPGPPHQAPVGEQDQVVRAEGQQVRAGHPALRDGPPARRAGLTGAPSPPPRWPARRGSWPPRGPPDRPAAGPGRGRTGAGRSRPGRPAPAGSPRSPPGP